MKKSHKIIYWIATIWLALAMVASGVQQVFQMKSFADIVLPLGYPMYFLTILGVWKILGAIVILLPRLPLIKEWAYAGFFFAMSGAVVSHLVMGNFAEAMPSIILAIMVMISWYFRPVEKKLIPVTV